MPHILVEYSSNLEPDLDSKKLVASLHAAAIDTGLFETHMIRTRAARRDVFCAGQDGFAGAFLHITVRIKIGRSSGQRVHHARTCRSHPPSEGAPAGHPCFE